MEGGPDQGVDAGPGHTSVAVQVVLAVDVADGQVVGGDGPLADVDVARPFRQHHDWEVGCKEEG